MERHLVEVVTAEKGEIFEVGGAVRDRLLGLAPKDNDYLVAGIPIDRLATALERSGCKVDLVGKSFGVLKVSKDGMTVDVALPRTERSTGVGHKDFAVTVNHLTPLAEDLSRRDFTINAIAVRLSDGAIFDPFGGQKDLRNGFLRTVGEAKDRFTEDPLRMLRAVRFVAKLDFWLDSRTLVALHEQAHLLETVAKERVQEEVVRMLSYGGKPQAVVRALELFRDTSLMARAFGRMETLRDEPKFDLRAVGFTVMQGAPLESRLTALFMGIPKMDDVLERLKFSNDMRKAIGTIALAQDRLDPEDDEVSFRRTLATFPSLALFEAALHVYRATVHSQFVMDQVALQKASEKALDRARALAWLFGFGQAQVALSGEAIVREFGISGRDIGDFKKVAMLAVIDGEATNEPEALLAFLRAFVAERGAEGVRRRAALRGLQDEEE